MGNPAALPGRLPEFDSSGNIRRFSERAAGGMPLMIVQAAPRTVEKRSNRLARAREGVGRDDERIDNEKEHGRRADEARRL